MRCMLSLLVVAIFLVAGCGFQPAKYFPWGEATPAEEGPEGISDGNRFFRSGDYAAAEALFLKLGQSGDAEVARQALYGLACTRLATAGDRREYLEAAELLARWQEISPDVAPGEDPRMLLALISETAGPVADGGSEPQPLVLLLDCREEIRSLEDRIDELKGRLAEADSRDAVVDEMAASLVEMKRRLSAEEKRAGEMAEELAKLKGQLKTLETIDQEIQEKKQGISSP